MRSRARRARQAARDERIVGRGCGAAGRRRDRTRRTPSVRPERAPPRATEARSGKMGAGRRRGEAHERRRRRSRPRGEGGARLPARRRSGGGKRGRHGAMRHARRIVRDAVRDGPGPARDAAARAPLDARRGVRRRPHPRGGRSRSSSPRRSSSGSPPCPRRPSVGLDDGFRAAQVLAGLLFLFRDAAGGSPGKKLFGLRLVRRGGADRRGPRRPSPATSPLLVPGWNLIELASVMRRRDGRRPGDRAGGTTLVEA